MMSDEWDHISLFSGTGLSVLTLALTVDNDSSVVIA